MPLPDTSKTKRPALFLIRATFSFVFRIGRRFVLLLCHIEVQCLGFGRRSAPFRERKDAYDAHLMPLREGQNVTNSDVLRGL